MAFKYEIAGKTVEFDSQPTDQDIDEVASQLSQSSQEGNFTQANIQTPMMGGNQASPVDPLTRLGMSFPKDPSMKAKLLSQAGFKNVQIEEDGSLSVNGVSVDPSPKGIISFLRDLPGDLGDLVGPSLPIAGQIGADIAYGATIPATAAPTLGASMAGFGAANAAGAAGGEALRQAIAAGLTGEQMSPQSIMGEGTLGGIGGAAGPLISPSFKFMTRETGKMLNPIVKKLGGSMPSVFESLFGIEKRIGLDVVNESASRKVSDFINDKTADPAFLGNVVRKTIFGTDSAEKLPENFIHQVKTQVGMAESFQKNIVKDFYAQVSGVSPSTVDEIIKTPVSELMHKANYSDDAIKNLSSFALKSLNETEEKLGNEIGQAMRKAGPKLQFKSFPVDDLASSLKTSLEIENPRGIGILRKSGMNSSYSGGEAKATYESILNTLYKKGENIPSKEGSRRAFLTPKKTLTLKQAHEFLREKQGLLDRAFEKGLTPSESRPLAEFLNQFRARFNAHLPEDIRPINKSLTELYDAKKFFRGDDPANTNNLIEAINRLRSVVDTKDPDITRTLTEGLQRIDHFMPDKDKILPRLNKIKAAREINATNFNESVDKLSKLAKEAAFPKDISAEAASRVASFDNSLPRDRFLRAAKDHVAASAFAQKQNFFRTRALYLMLAGGLGAGIKNPFLFGTGMAGFMSAAQPSKIARGLDTLNKSGFGKMAGRIPQVSPDNQRRLLSMLVRMGSNGGNQ